MSDTFATRSARLVQQIRPILAGKPAPVQGAALADLLAIWLAGHRAETPQATAGVRALLLKEHIATVWELIPANEAP